MIYVLTAHEKLDSFDDFLQTNRLSVGKPRQFASLKAAKDYADQRIGTFRSGSHLVAEIEEKTGPRAKTGTIKYRVERTADGKIRSIPLV